MKTWMKKPFKQFSIIPGFEQVILNVYICSIYGFKKNYIQISFKNYLAKSGIPWITPGFELPGDLSSLEKYAALHPEKMFIKKSFGHAHISPIQPELFKNVTQFSLVQEVIGQPFLVQGYKFDISKYVLITSVDPLR